MKKIAIYSKYINSFYYKYLQNLINELYKENDVTLITTRPINIHINIKYVVLEEIDYWNNNNDYKEYNSVLNYVENNKFENLFILRLNYEIFNSVFEFYNFKSNLKISFAIFGHREIIETNTRFDLIKNIARKKRIKSILVHSIIKDVKKNKQLETLNSKFKFISDPIYDFVNVIPKKINKTINYIYFGNFFYGKGADIFLKAINLLPRKIKSNFNFILAGNFNTKNFDFKLGINKNIKFINKFLDEKEVSSLFKKSDVIVLPYRNTYKDDTSGVFVQATQYNKLLICPDFNPFKAVLNKYKLGVTFKSESSEDLSKQLIYTYNNIINLKSKSKCELFIISITTWKEISKLLFD